MANSNGRVVLLCTVDSVRETVVRGHSIKLRGWLVHHGSPVGTTILRNLGTAIIGDNHALVVGRINPQVMVVSMRSIRPFKGFTTIRGFMVTHIEDINGLLILGICKDPRIIPGTLTEATVFIYQRPSLPSIFGGVDASFVVFNDGIQSIGILRRNGDPHDAQKSFWKSFFGGKFFPSFPSVGGFK